MRTSKYDWLDDLNKENKIELFQLGFDAGEKLINNNKQLFNRNNK